MKKIVLFVFLLIPITASAAKSDRFLQFYSKTTELEEIQTQANKPVHKFGVRQEKLDMYRNGHPKYNFPKNIKDLKRKQAEQLLNYFWNNYRFDDLKYAEIQEKVWDMFVKMTFSELEKNINECINKYYEFSENLGFYAPFGSLASIRLLNGMKSENVENFMEILNGIKY